MSVDLRSIKERLAKARAPQCITLSALLPTLAHVVAVDAPALVSEVESLRALLLRYGQHEQGCNFSRIDHEDGRVEWERPCTCGLASAIREEP